MINDGTGSMRCSKYLDEGSHVSYPGEKEFVKVFGRLKKFSGDSWSVSIYHVAKVCISLLTCLYYLLTYLLTPGN